MNTFDVGDLIRLSAAFTNIQASPIDPTAVTLRIKQPDGTVTVVTSGITHDGTGNYHYDFSIAQRGNHYYRWEGTGTAQASGESTFRVRRSNVI